jgi:hypothetical protein
MGLDLRYLLHFGYACYLSLLRLLFTTFYLKTYTLHCTCCSNSYMAARKTTAPESPTILHVYEYNNKH